MKRSLRSFGLSVAFVALAVSALAVSTALHAQTSRDAASPLQQMQRHMQQSDMPAMQHHMRGANVAPTMPGQDAFGAIQEIVHMFEADPKTDWSKVDLEALRQHLIDMNEVTLKSKAKAEPIEGGLKIAVTGEGRTSEAIQRMVTAHAHEIEETHLNGWSAKTEPLADGIVLTVTATDPREVIHLRGLGFIGIMVSGQHHQLHHLAIAHGDMVH
jgi:hypothetical protein